MGEAEKPTPDKFTPNARSNPPLGAMLVSYLSSASIFLLFGILTPPERWMPRGQPWHRIAQVS